MNNRKTAAVLCVLALVAAAALLVFEPPVISADRIEKSDQIRIKLAQAEEKPAEKAPAAESGTKAEPAAGAQAAPEADKEEAWPEEAPDIFKVRFETTKGNFIVEVHKDWAPKGAQRFYTLVKKDFYNENRFFRVVPGFVVQFGLNGNPMITRKWSDARIKDDPVKQSNLEAYMSFASAGPNSRTTQVFINLGENSRLDHYGVGFPPFGKVIEGMDTVNKFNGQYGDATTRKQAEISTFGNEWLDENFPGLDYVKKAVLVK